MAPAAGTLLRPRELGFALTLRHGLRSLMLALGAGLAFGLWMAMADTWLFAAAVPPVQHAMLVNVPVLSRIALFARGALFDELWFRLIALTGLAWLIARSTGLRGARAVWPAILLVALSV